MDELRAKSTVYSDMADKSLKNRIRNKLNSTIFAIRHLCCYYSFVLVAICYLRTQNVLQVPQRITNEEWDGSALRWEVQSDRRSLEGNSSESSEAGLSSFEIRQECALT